MTAELSKMVFQDGNYLYSEMDPDCCWSPHTQMWLAILAGVLFKKCANEALARQLFVRMWGTVVRAANASQR